MWNLSTPSVGYSSRSTERSRGFGHVSSSEVSLTALHGRNSHCPRHACGAEEYATQFLVCATVRGVCGCPRSCVVFCWGGDTFPATRHETCYCARRYRYTGRPPVGVVPRDTAPSPVSRTPSVGVVAAKRHYLSFVCRGSSAEPEPHAVDTLL